MTAPIDQTFAVRSLRRWGGAALCVSVLVAASCVVESFDLVSSPPGTVGAASGGQGGQGGAMSNGGSGATCQHFSWPNPPTTADAGNDLPDIVLATRQLDIGELEVDSGLTVGFDLDNRCTCQGENASCNAPTWATADHCDAPAGRDNAAAALWKQAILFEPQISSAEMSIDIDQGEFSLLFRVRGYNGQANDDQVDVAIYSSPGLGADPCWPAGQQARWDGSDPWPVLALSLLPPLGSGGAGGGGGAGGSGGAGGPGTAGGGGCTVDSAGYDLERPRFDDPNAYVANGTLVASLPQATFVFANKQQLLPLELAAGFIAGELSLQGDGSWTLENTIFTGRWKIDNLLRTLLDAANRNGPVCAGDQLYGVLKGAVCPHVDIASSLGGPTTPCDAVSFAMRLRAEQAQLGVVYDAPLFVASCPAGQGPADATCP
jgi:hypothetical protein